MSEDLPYNAEYAKSGRAGCKSCKCNIGKDSLRIAKMVQSPHFDGKIPQWYHYSCFFKKFKPLNVSDIKNFDSLRWDDQEKLREQIGCPQKKDVVDGPSNSTVNKDFCIEYAKSGRAKCRKCEEKIEKDIIRIAKIMESEESKFKGLIPFWYHVKCFALSKSELEAQNLTSNEIDGWGELSEEDQEKVGLEIKFKKHGKLKIKKGNKINIKDECKDEEKKEIKDEKVEKFKLQNKEYWDMRDKLQKNVPNNVLRKLLDANNYNTTGGENTLLERCADGICFGALLTCSECKTGNLVYRTEGYQCTGHVSGWTSCTFLTQTPKRKKWHIPKELLLENDFLSTIKPKVEERTFMTTTKMNTDIKESQKRPLENRKVIVIGKLKESKGVIENKIQLLGGTLSAAVSKSCYCCISTQDEIEKSTKKMQTVKTYNIPVVTENFLDAVQNGEIDALMKNSIAPWGTNREMLDDKMDNFKSMKRKTSSSIESSKKAKVIMKGGAVVDPDSGLEGKCHILSVRGELFTAVLGLVDLLRGTNSYYKIQALEHDTKKKYYVFRSWGRVGTTIGGNKLEHFVNQEDAIENFKEVYGEKTGNTWSNRKDFVKYPNKFYPLDIDYGQNDEMLQSSITPGSLSILPNPVKELIKLIFDVEAMKHALVEFEIDMKKMPLGKLSKKQIETAYGCLGDCQKFLANNDPGSKILDASNRFYTLIPHDFGMKKPPLLDNEELIKLKIGMLDSLMEIEVAYNLIKGTKDNGAKDPIDLHYETLKTDIKVVDKESKDFELIVEYVKNTHAKTHSNYSLDVIEVFSIERAGEKQRYRPFKDLFNKKLLWHGSRTTNYAGILSQGLRIAPPEAPVTGYMFGKGIYFADMASKSANYCCTTRSNNTGLMLLCEVALGNMYELKQSEHISKLPPGKHSCKGLGSTSPDPSMDKVIDGEVLVPLGKPISTNIKDSTLLYNEYIVYDVAQVNIKYLVQLKFNYCY
ncbi:poly [ADP-ribose] polymerase 1 isoform X1 [Hydra vulgaris]|uniref:poly [ADP-ribose] polymerase 1 isoform X1 n=1 Tax=Hydra vulgaris TaxID=6087 RepID=UPI001F5EC7F8|nr:poly [ADP-ribose] polymerase 1 [Hydra vulgaris]